MEIKKFFHTHCLRCGTIVPTTNLQKFNNHNLACSTCGYFKEDRKKESYFYILNNLMIGHSYDIQSEYKNSIEQYRVRERS